MSNQGFSLTEVLIALFLFASILVNIGTNQWKSAQSSTDCQILNAALLQLNNCSETLLSGNKIGNQNNLPIKIKRFKKNTQIAVNWSMLKRNTLPFAELKQQLALDNAQ